MLPVLEFLADGTTRSTVPEITNHLSSRFHLTQEDQDQRLPSGVQATFTNRTHWTATYFAKAGVIDWVTDLTAWIPRWMTAQRPRDHGHFYCDRGGQAEGSYRRRLESGLGSDDRAGGRQGLPIQPRDETGDSGTA